MATVVVGQPATPGDDCRSAIQVAHDSIANNGDIIRLSNNQASPIWNVSGYTDPNGTGGDSETLGGNGPGALGALEFTKNITLQLDSGVTLREMASTPLVGTWQPLVRFFGGTGVGITFGAGSKILGRTPYVDATSEWRAGAKFTGCTGVTITGTGEVHFQDHHGDGLWFSSGGFLVLGPAAANTGVVVNNVYATGNLRSGITCEDCVGTFNNPKCTANFGAAPQVGMNIETDNPSDTLQVTVNGGYFEGRSHGLLVQIADALTPAIQIALNNCKSVRSALAGDDPWGFDFSVVASSTPANSYIRCTNLQAIGLKSAGYRFGATTTYKIDTALAVTMRNCIADRCSTAGLDSPFDLALSGAATGGGITFNDCVVIDDKIRKAVAVTSTGGAATNVRGTIRVQNSAGLRTVDQANSLLSRLNVVPVGRPRFSNKKKARVSASRGAV